MSGEACVYCLYGGAPSEAQARFEAQPSLTVSVFASDQENATRYHVSRDIDPEVKAKMIKDPAPAQAALEAHLEVNPCEFNKTGRCAVAEFAVDTVFNQPIVRKI